MSGGEGEVFQIGSNDEISIGNLVKLISEVAGKKVQVVCDKQRLRPEKSEVLRLKCDNSKLKKATQFAPSIPLRDGLERTFRWFSEASTLRWYKGDLYNV
jgi:nucleoside-diphosphate-sugar epimerase